MPDLTNQVCNSVSGKSSNYKGIKHKENVGELLDVFASQEMAHIHVSPYNNAENVICAGIIQDCAGIIKSYIETHPEIDYYNISTSLSHLNCD